MLNSIKKYLAKAKEEISKDYTVRSPQSSSGQQGGGAQGWIGVDLDGTLAYDDPRLSISQVGDPVPEMLARVKQMIDKGMRVKIFTARASDTEQLPIIRKWLADHGLPELEITNVKDYNMLRLYDDRAIQVEHNTGRLISKKSSF